MNDYNLLLNDMELDVLIHMISFGQIEIQRQLKRLNEYDYDIKEHYGHYRSIGNQIKRKLSAMRGY